MESYEVRRYYDAKRLGEIELTDKQFLRFQDIAQQPQGIAQIGDLPHDLYALDPEWQDLPPDTVIYLE